MTEIEEKAKLNGEMSVAISGDLSEEPIYKEGFKDGYEQGQKDIIRGDCSPIRYVLVDLIDSNNPIALLRKENAELKKSYTDLQKMWNELVDHDRDMFNKTLQLEAQIEKMKCCGNCNFKINKGCEGTIWLGKEYCDKWELAE